LVHPALVISNKGDYCVLRNVIGPGPSSTTYLREKVGLNDIVEAGLREQLKWKKAYGPIGISIPRESWRITVTSYLVG
jgi:hypothetical protein